MATRLALALVLASSALLLCSTSVLAQGKSANRKAQASYEAGTAAKQKGDDLTATIEFHKAIELDRGLERKIRRYCGLIAWLMD